MLDKTPFPSSQYVPPSFTQKSSPPVDYDMSHPPQVQSNTYHVNQSGNDTWALPPGWKIGYRDFDGRMYYWNMSTGQSSWSHPLAPAPGDESGGRGSGNRLRPQSATPLFPLNPLSAPDQADIDRRMRNLETPTNASKRPDSHNCCALVSCIVFPPLGIFALIHSLLTYRSWDSGRYGDAHDHSRQAYTFAWWSIAIFIAFLIYHFFIRDGGLWDFNFFD